MDLKRRSDCFWVIYRDSLSPGGSLRGGWIILASCFLIRSVELILSVFVVLSPPMDHSEPLIRSTLMILSYLLVPFPSMDHSACDGEFSR